MHLYNRLGTNHQPAPGEHVIWLFKRLLVTSIRTDSPANEDEPALTATNLYPYHSDSNYGRRDAHWPDNKARIGC